MQLRKRKLDDMPQNIEPPKDVSLRVKPTAFGTTIDVQQGVVVGDLREKGLRPVEMLSQLLSKYDRAYQEEVVNTRMVPCRGNMDETQFGLIKLAQKQTLIGDSIGVVSKKLLNQRICPLYENVYESIERLGHDRMGSINVIIHEGYGGVMLRKKSDIIRNATFFMKWNARTWKVAPNEPEITDQRMSDEKFRSYWIAKKLWEKQTEELNGVNMIDDDSPSENIKKMIEYVEEHDITIVGLSILHIGDEEEDYNEATGHANILTYNRKQRTLERFDPNLETYKKYGNDLNRVLEKELAAPYGYTYIHAGQIMSCPIFPQSYTRSVFREYCRGGGLCVIYSAMYAYLRIVYPMENWQYIVSDLVSVEPKKLLEMAWRFWAMTTILCKESQCSASESLRYARRHDI